MVEITLFELHLPGAQFNAPFSGAGDGSRAHADDEPAADESVADDGSAAGPVLALVAAVLVLALVAWLARRSRRSVPSDDGP